jgi:UDP-glucuronate decarboxylase
MNLIQEDTALILDKFQSPFFDGKSVLITGASGLVGSYLLEYFQQLRSRQDSQLQLFVSSKSGEFVVPLANSTKVVSGDICDPNVLKKIPNADIVIHAAGYAQPGKFLGDPMKTLKINTQVTAELVEKVNTGGRFLFISSSEVYSGLKHPPFSENQIGNSATDHPRAAYIEGKRTGETISSIANQIGRISSSSIRLSLAYGPGTKPLDSRVMSDFINQALRESTITMRDQGNAWRTYGYISDILELIMSILINGKEKIYNVGGESRVQVKDLAELISELTSCKVISAKSSDQFLSGAPDDVWLDLTKSKNLSNKNEFVDLKEGLSRTILWHKLMSN